MWRVNGRRVFILPKEDDTAQSTDIPSFRSYWSRDLIQPTANPKRKQESIDILTMIHTLTIVGIYIGKNRKLNRVNRQPNKQTVSRDHSTNL